MSRYVPAVAGHELFGWDKLKKEKVQKRKTCQVHISKSIRTALHTVLVSPGALDAGLMTMNPHFQVQASLYNAFLYLHDSIYRNSSGRVNSSFSHPFITDNKAQ